MTLVQGLVAAPPALADDARPVALMSSCDIGDSNMSDARPGAPLSPLGLSNSPAHETARVVKVFARRKLGEAVRSAEHPIILSVEMLLQFRNISLKDAAMQLVRPSRLTTPVQSGDPHFCPPPPTLLRHI